MQISVSKGTNSPSYKNAVIQYTTDLTKSDSWHTITNFPLTTQTTPVSVPMASPTGFFRSFAYTGDTVPASLK